MAPAAMCYRGRSHKERSCVGAFWTTTRLAIWARGHRWRTVRHCQTGSRNASELVPPPPPRIDVEHSTCHRLLAIGPIQVCGAVSGVEDTTCVSLE